MKDTRHVSAARSIRWRTIPPRSTVVHLGLTALLILGCSAPSGPATQAPTESGTGGPPAAKPGVSLVYALKSVNAPPLPVKSPYGAGEWDYDADAGTWQLIGATFSVNDDGTYTNAVVHQARSGNTGGQSFSGTYKLTTPSSLELHASGSTISTSATISGNQLIWNWGNGTIMTFER